MTRKRRKANKTGRSQDGIYARIEFEFLKSDCFRQLPGAAVKVFFDLRSRYNLYNNGKITLSLDECARLLSMGKGTAIKALSDLEERGLVRRTKKGRWLGRKASEWELTMLPRDGHMATNEWKMWRSKKPLREARPVSTRYQDGYVKCFEGSDTEPRH